MMMLRFCLSFCLLFSGVLICRAQTLTVGLLEHSPGSMDGYVLFAPIDSKHTYLIDKCGRVVHQWQSSRKPGQSVYLLPDGQLLRTINDSSSVTADDAGKIEKLDWNGKVTWSFRMDNAQGRRHHDVCAMPNGNILVLLWDKKTNAEAIEMGRDPHLLTEGLWSEKIIEIKPVGTNSYQIVWEWRVWDHLVQEFDPDKPNYGQISRNPGLFNINYPNNALADWLHFNSIDYNARLDQIIVSNRNFSEFFIIDHGTTTEEAAGHIGGRRNKGGDILYRWGNPKAYERGELEDQVLFSQHNAHWIPETLKDGGKIMVFNNGLNRPEGKYSTVEIVEPPLDANEVYTLEERNPFAPAQAQWKYKAPVPTDFYSRNISGAQRLPNGNTLICEGANGKFFEIDRENNVVWKYINPVSHFGPAAQGSVVSQNHVFRCVLYEKNYGAFKGRLLKPGKPIELNPATNSCDHIPKK